MPIYEYQCRRCHHNFEQIILSTREKVICPQCDSRAVEKRLSVFSSPSCESEKSVPTSGCGGCGPQGCGCH
ncbi:MAG: FmdB family zinc ribbon protein [Alphaproteobacteria bacterium]